MFEKREFLGKLFFGAAILILLYMFISPISNVFIHVDEYWTYSLVNLPFINRGSTRCPSSTVLHDSASVHPFRFE